MRLLWITISLAMFQCNYGADESSTVSDTQIDEFEELEELFKLNATVENNSGNKAVEKPNVSAISNHTKNSLSAFELPLLFTLVYFLIAM